MSELDDLTREAWTAPAAKVKELWKRARKLPEMARSAWAYEWVRKKRYETDHRLDQNALEWTAIGLALHGDPRVVPFIVARAGERWDFGRLLVAWLDTDRLDRERVATAVRPWIQGDDTGVHEWKLAARCLAFVGTPADATIIADRLGTCFDAMWSPDAGQTVRMEGHAASLGASLLRIGVPRSFVPMLEAVACSEGTSIDRARGTAALLLAEAGCGLDAIARGLRWQLDHDRASRVTAGQLLALGTLGRGLASEARTGLARLVERAASASDGAELTFAAALAHTDLGEPSDVAAAARACLAHGRYGWSDVVAQTVFVLEQVGARSDLPAELAIPFVRDDDSRIHRAAYRALKRRRAASPAIRVVDACTLHHSSAESLRDAIADAGAVPQLGLAEHLAANPIPEAATALVERFALLPPSRHDGDPRRATQRAWLRAVIASGSPDAHALVARVAKEHEALVTIDELPLALASVAATIVLRSKDKRRRDEAKAWLSRRSTEPEVVRALESLGLSPEDFPRRTR